MKFLVALAFVALACAEETYLRSKEYEAPIVRSDYEISPEGAYNYVYETGNGIAAQASGTWKNPNSEAATLEVKGSYRYPSPDGSAVELTYEADENGYRPQSNSLPVPPPIPELILRSLEYIAAHPPPAEYVKNTA